MEKGTCGAGMRKKRVTIFAVVFLLSSYVNGSVFALNSPDGSQVCDGLLASNPLTRALTVRQLGRLQLSKNEVTNYDTVVAAIKNASWNLPLFNPLDRALSREIPRIAFHAYLIGQITIEQFATQAIRWSALNDFEPTSVTEFLPAVAFDNEGKPTNAFRERFLSRWPFLNDPTLTNEFVNEVKQLPASEQALWSYTSKKHLKVAEHSAFFSTAAGDFYAFLNEDQASVTVRFPSFGLIKVFFEIAFRKQKIKLIPQLGQIDDREVRSGILEGGRVLNLHLPYLPGVLDADGTKFLRFESTSHDLNHLIEGAVLPLPYRLAYMRFYDVLKKIREQQTNSSSRVTLKFSRPVKVQGTTVTNLEVIDKVNNNDGSFLDLSFGFYYRGAAGPNDDHGQREMLEDLSRTVGQFFERDFRGSLHVNPISASVVDKAREVGSMKISMGLGVILWDMIEHSSIYQAMGLDLHNTAEELKDPVAKELLQAGLK